MPEKDDEICMYCGKDIETMSREELVAAFRHMARLYQQSLHNNIEAHRATADMMRLATRARFGAQH